MFQLRFRCPLPDVPVVDGRRYCASCEKVVTDLTRCSRDEADAWMRTNPGACVRLPGDRVTASLRAAAALGLSLAAGAAHAKHPDEVMGDVMEDPEPVQPAVLSAHATGFDRPEDAAAAEATVLNHPGPFRTLLDPGGRVREVRTLTLEIAPDGAVREVTSSTLNLDAKGYDAAMRKVKATRFPKSAGGAHLDVSFGPEA